MKRILITGANGFIGKHLSQHLQNQPGLSLTLLKGRAELDLCDPSACSQIPMGDVCIHLAGAGNPIDFDQDPEQAWRSNLSGTLNLLQAIQAKGYQRFILASTYVYGAPDYLPVDEIHPVRPPHPYPRSKYLCEQMLEEFTRQGQLTGIALRLFNVYGPHQSDHMLIPTILQQLSGSEIRLRDALPKRDFVHISDVCAAFEKSITASIEGFDCLNIASGHSLSVAELVQAIQTAAKTQIPVSYSHQARPNEVNQVVGDIQHARELLHWQPKVSLKQGLGALI